MDNHWPGADDDALGEGIGRRTFRSQSQEDQASVPRTILSEPTLFFLGFQSRRRQGSHRRSR